MKRKIYVETSVISYLTARPSMLQRFKPGNAIIIGEIDVLAPIPSCGDVIERAA